MLADGWDAQGNVVSVVLADPRENIFWIKAGPVADGLTRYLHASVEIAGRVETDEKGRSLLTATSFVVLLAKPTPKTSEHP